jgi:glycosyltransferase involved in cell wall biosynthesis
VSDGPLVSVVTPCLNAVRFIEKTIESVSSQDYPHVEHIIMDGASTDGTLGILEKHPGVIWASEPDRGQSHALNKAFRRAQGEIIGWLNADDVYQPRAISRAVEFLQKSPDVDFIYSDCIELDGDDLPVRRINGHPVKNYHDLVFRQPIPQPTIFFRRRVLETLGGVDEELHYVMDWEFWLRASFDFKFAHLPGETLAGFRKYAGTKSHASSRIFNEEWMFVLRKQVEHPRRSGPDAAVFERGIRYQSAQLHIADVLQFAQEKKRLAAFGTLLKAVKEFRSGVSMKTFAYLLFVIYAGGDKRIRREREKPVNVLYVQAGRGVGGAKISLLHLIDSLAQQRICVFLALSHPADDIFGQMADSKISSIHTLYLPFWYQNRSLRSFDRLMAFLSKVLRGWYIIPSLRLAYFILKHKIDLVHSNSSATPVGALAALLTGRPHVWHVREPIGADTEFPLVLGDHVSARLMRMLSREIICISEYTGQFFTKQGIKPQIVLNGINTGEFDAAVIRGNELRKKLRLRTRVVIGMVGNLRASWKEHAVFLRSMALVLEKAPDIQFVVFGGTSDLNITEYTRSLDQIARSAGLNDHLIWAEHVDDIPAIMHGFDVLVHPASREGSGRVIMEAMAAGRAVVAVRSGGGQELVQQDQTGLLVEPKNPVALADAVLVLMNDPEKMDRMGRQAQSYARAHFSHERTASQVLDIYRRVLRKSTNEKV